MATDGRAILGARAVLAMVVSASLHALGGCAETASTPLRVTVRDAHTNAPVPGAAVIAQTPSHNHPLSPASLLGQTGPESITALTDERGEATLACVPGRTVRIGVLAPGYPVLIESIEDPWRCAATLTGERFSRGDPIVLQATVEPAADHRDVRPPQSPAASNARRPPAVSPQH